MCGEAKVEDEIHFLVNCPRYEETRQHLYLSISLDNNNLSTLPDDQKCIWMLSQDDKLVNILLSKLVTECSDAAVHYPVDHLAIKQPS